LTNGTSYLKITSSSRALIDYKNDNASAVPIAINTDKKE
jgi:hypothetical protein